MAKEKFLIVATRIPEDCFGRFSESANCAAIDAGTADPADPYSWIEASFELQLVRYREATHICSFTPSAHYVWLQNFFVGEPNAAWNSDGDPAGLEYENGGEDHGYGTYRDEYDPRFIAETFTIDTVKHLGLRAPSRKAFDKREAYHDAIWDLAEETAREMLQNGFDAPILNVWTYRQWRREQHLKVRARAAADSRRLAAHFAMGG